VAVFCVELLIKRSRKKNLIFYFKNFNIHTKSLFFKNWHQEVPCVQQDCHRKKAQQASRSGPSKIYPRFEEFFKIAEFQLQTRSEQIQERQKQCKEPDSQGKNNEGATLA
jgi:hypothetical protein